MEIFMNKELCNGKYLPPLNAFTTVVSFKMCGYF